MYNEWRPNCRVAQGEGASRVHTGSLLCDGYHRTENLQVVFISELFGHVTEAISSLRSVPKSLHLRVIIAQTAV